MFDAMYGGFLGLTPHYVLEELFPIIITCRPP